MIAQGEQGESTMGRTTQEVLQHHAEAVAAGDLDGVLADYTDDAVLITPQGTFTGAAGAREAWSRLLGDLPNAQLALTAVVVEGDVVLMRWTATSDNGRVDDGVDTLVLGGDGIRVQTVHYTLHN
jgi:ketosteroid isomerase-like protein